MLDEIATPGIVPISRPAPHDIADSGRCTLEMDDARSAFEFVERSKSRTLMDQMERSVETGSNATGEESPRLGRIQKVREELNILYSRLNELGTTGRAAASDSTTRDEIAKREQEFRSRLATSGEELLGRAVVPEHAEPPGEALHNILALDGTPLAWTRPHGQAITWFA